MIAIGMNASELIKLLQKLIKEHGDHPVYSGGGDYPEAVRGVQFERRGDAYVPANSFKL